MVSMSTRPIPEAAGCSWSGVATIGVCDFAAPVAVAVTSSAQTCAMPVAAAGVSASGPYSTFTRCDQPVFQGELMVP